MPELKRAGVKLTADGTAQYKADLKSATAALRQMAEESKRNVVALGNNASASKKYGLAIKDLGNTAKLAQAKLNVLQDRQKQLSESSRIFASEINKLENKMKTAKGDTTELSNALAELRSKESLNNAELHKLNATIARTETQMIKAKNAASQMIDEYRNAGGRFADVSEKLKTVGNKFDDAGNKATNLGKTMTTRVTTPIVAGFGYATKAYIDFDNQMNQMKVQLDDGSQSASQLKYQVEELGKSSQNMAKEYGVAGASIRNGMNELIKKGFTFNQVSGAMPSILKATVASGDDFNTVMNVSSNVLEQFGLKVDDTNQMLTNTDRVTSVLTFAANKTSAGFSDLGEAMQNVGPMAANNNQSLEDMASTLGILANRGIEGGEAGTYLMNALQNLATPTKEQSKGLKELGVSAFDANGKMRAFPDILSDIEKATAGMSDEQKNAALNTIFNTQAMKGINPLIQAGSKSIKDLSSSTKDASKYQDELAKKMGESASKNVDKMKESFKVLAETIGAKVLPHIIPLINKATELANKFGDLDGKTKDTIVKIAALAAAVGPLSLGFGGILRSIGGVVRGVGSLAQGFGKLTSSTAKITKGAGKATTGVSKIGSMAKKVGALAPLLSNPYGLAFGAIVGASAGVGYLIYKELHKDDENHKTAVNQTKGKYEDWYKTITSGAKDASGSQKQIQDATKKTGETYKEVTERLKKQNTDVQETMKKGWDGYEKKIEGSSKIFMGIAKDTTKHIEGLKEKLKDLGLDKKDIDNAKQNYENYATMLGNTFTEFAKTAEKSKVVTRETASATIEATKRVTDEVVNSLNKEKEEKLNKLKQDQEYGILTQEQYQSETQKINDEYGKRVKALQDNQEKIRNIMANAAQEHRKLTSDEVASVTKAYLKLSESTGQAITDNTEAQKFFSENLQQMLTDSGLAALKHADIISSSTEDSIKKAKSTEEAMKILKKALEDYDNKDVKEKKIKAKDETSEEVKKASEAVDKHNEKEVKEKELKAKDKTTEEANKANKSLDEYINKKVDEKVLKLKDETKEAKDKAKKAIEDYNNIKADIKKLKAKDEASEKTIKAKEKIIDYNKKQADKKILKAEDKVSDLTKKVKKALEQIDKLEIQVKELKAKDEASAKAFEAKGKLDDFNNTKMATKNLEASGNASPFTDEAQDKLNIFNSTGIPTKVLSATGNATPFTGIAQSAINLFNSTGIPTKHLPATGNAKAFTDDAKHAVDRYNWTDIPEKSIHVSSNAVEQSNSAIGALNSIPRFIRSTINVVRNFFNNEHAQGGHIDAYAEGGNIQSHSVPGTYTGIVGEAGPEIFSVNRGNVTITPLNSREKMRGIEGVLQDYTGGKNSNAGVVVNINLNDMVVKEEADENRLINKMEQHLKRTLAEQQMIGGA
ncbi:phage tail tape measure protein [Staphylococcus aureus]|uniref:phage tail tape measure protein n=1 Tax=Staphylococcus aureus TaxID=1280 RepID=UPI0013D9DE88|nr:phage tail tape measure protein [Staphylococcus aureus]NEF22923.1 phage tail tape measure protein [Staphylococcus aureus]